MEDKMIYGQRADEPLTTDPVGLACMVGKSLPLPSFSFCPNYLLSHLLHTRHVESNAWWLSGWRMDDVCAGTPPSRRTNPGGVWSARKDKGSPIYRKNQNCARTSQRKTMPLVGIKASEPAASAWIDPGRLDELWSSYGKGRKELAA